MMETKKYPIDKLMLSALCCARNKMMDNGDTKGAKHINSIIIHNSDDISSVLINETDTILDALKFYKEKTREGFDKAAAEYLKICAKALGLSLKEVVLGDLYAARDMYYRVDIPEMGDEMQERIDYAWEDPANRIETGAESVLRDIAHYGLKVKDVCAVHLMTRAQNLAITLDAIDDAEMYFRVAASQLARNR